jgi:hypothetical protein
MLLILFWGDRALADPPVAGSWFGQGQPGDPDWTWLEHLIPDGSYLQQNHKCVKEREVGWIERGHWKQSDGMLTIVTEFSDGKSVHYEDVYKTVLDDGHRWLLQAVSNDYGRAEMLGYMFKASRVSDDFHMPDCGKPIA